MSNMEAFNQRTTSLPIGWHDDDPNAPEVPFDVANDPAMRVLLHAKAALATKPLGTINHDLPRWVLGFTAAPDRSWGSLMTDARLRLRILHALGVAYGAIPPAGYEFSPYSRPTSDRMVLDRAIDWLHGELLAGS